MEVITHVVIAISSILYTGYVYLSPSRAKLRISYFLVALTLATGTYLVYVTQSPILQACISGLVYLGIEFFGIAMAQRKLSAKPVTIHTSHRG